jgi:ankyrin repeat protein
VQVRTDEHVEHFEKLEELFQNAERSFDENEKRFFELFTESTPEGSRAAVREMKEIASRETKHNQKVMMFHSLALLIRTDSKKLRWPNSPLRMMLLFVDANVRWATAEDDPREELATGFTLLHHLSYQIDPKDYSYHKNQVNLGQQLFRHGANANLVALPAGCTSLHVACQTSAATNLDCIQLLLENGASPNA